MSQELVYNYYINTAERNHQLTIALVKRVVDNALLRDVRLFDQDVDNLDGDTISNDEKIIRFLVKSIKSVNTRNISLLLNYRCTVEDYIEKIIAHLYDSQTCTWELIVCLFAAMDTIVFEEAYYSIRYGYHDNIVASANSRIIPFLIDAISRVEEWVLRNNGWMALLDNFDPATAQTETLVRDMSYIVSEM
jgi:hypothetical protein